MSFRIPLVAVIALILAGCVATPNSAALRVGMTKAEAVAAMGQPTSVSAQGGLEYLNYSITETSPSSYSSFTRPYYVRLVDGHVEAFGFSEQINRTLPAAVSAANARIHSDALKIGMTKEEAIAAMGAPTIVSAEGNYQYLNYMVSEASPSGTSSMMRPYSVRLVDGHVEAFGFSNQLNRIAPPPVVMPGARNEAAAAADTVSVVAIEPASLVPGKRQPVAVKVHYSIHSRPKAVIAVLFNTSEPDRYRPVPGGEEIVSSGTGEVVLKGDITPVDWGAAGKFGVRLHLLDYPHVPGVYSQPLISVLGAVVPLAK
jgi:hypothetical protein